MVYELFSTGAPVNYEGFQNKNNGKNNGKNNNKKNTNSNSNENNNKNNKNNKKNNTNNPLETINISITDNKSVISFWILWFITVVLLLSTYITTPIRFSEKKVSRS